jgi:hypothetical protein
MEGYGEYREAARAGILAAGAEPVLVEDFPSLCLSPRTACLDGVASCDIYLAIIGSRGGWTAPSGKLVVEEEYEEARKRKLSLLAFIQETDADDGARRLAARLSDYISGMFRTTFSLPEDLRAAVTKALAPMVDGFKHAKAESPMIKKKLMESFSEGYDAFLRIVLVPERPGQLIDPVDLESPDLYQSVMEIGHSRSVRLFSYDRRKEKEIGVDEISITQLSSRGDDITDVVKLELSSSGALTIDTNVTGRVLRGERDGILNSSVIAEEDIAGQLGKIFAFSSTLLDRLDPYGRYDRLLYNVALSNVGYRKLEANPKPKSTYQMSMRSDNAPVPAFETPRMITRADLRASEREIEAVITLLRRRLKD